MLPARNRMKRSTEFDATVKHGVRAVQPDLVIYAIRGSDEAGGEGPRIGLIVGKAVGSAVQRHQVARRIRHVARGILGELDARDQVVIRALAGSRRLSSARLEEELRSGLRHIRELTGPTG
ncbi:ribonuclease P protein component [Mycobacterium xenopi]|uniref:ribonuclease P protein component n=1 Tax=Mycobacterium xenopi TaxID=1789 RepID=UPI0022EB2B79|nr:ribonuclease P protein component [Mycobacterium xenopi]MDA3656947.1 ribonuclease P protein component [Mycobacterium xenopi]